MLRTVVAMFLLTGTCVVSRAQAFASFETYGDTVGTNAYALVAGDFNKDGKPDLLQCCNGSDQLVVRFGNGDGTFQAPVTAFATPVGLYNAVTADVNGDGNLDLVAIAGLNPPPRPGAPPIYLMVWLGNGDGTFQNPQSYSTTEAPNSIMVGNFFGSSQTDVAVAEDNSTIDLFQSQGNGSYIFRKSISVVSGVMSTMTAVAGDLNGNGVSDIAVMELKGTSNTLDFATPQQLYVLWNDGHGNFTPQDYGGSYTFPTIAVSRLNGVAQMDVLVSYSCQSGDVGCIGVDAYYGQGNDNIIKRTLIHSTTGPNPGDVATLQGVDLNGDGYGDIFTIGDMLQNDSSSIPAGAAVWLGNADGSFQQTPQIFLTSNMGEGGAVAAADFNRDGRLDFAQASPGTGGTTEYYINASSSYGCNSYTISPSVTVCQPEDNTFSPTTLYLMASSYDSSAQVTQMQVYIDGALKFSQAVTTFAQTFTLAKGPHSVVTKAWDAKGASFLAERNITVFDGAPGPACASGPREASLCLPANLASDAPILIVGNGNTGNYVPTAAQLYIDNQLVVNNLSQCDENNDCYGGNSALITSQHLSAGSHYLVFKVWDTAGHMYTASRSISVN